MSVEAEIDTINLLLAFAVVHKLWQDPEATPLRGHNIGAVLTNRHGYPVAWAVNASTSERNLTQHAEVRLMQKHIAESEGTALSKHSIYTTLEPCAMCAGMMLMTDIKNVVYGQADPLYGAVFERLQSHSPSQSPYPGRTESRQSDLDLAATLDLGFKTSDSVETIDWLPTVQARSLYELAARQFADFRTAHAENTPRLDQAHILLDGIPTPESSGHVTIGTATGPVAPV